MRKLLRRARCRCINKLVRKIRLLSKKSTDESYNARNKQKVEKMQSDLHCIKKLESDKFSKYALTCIQSSNAVLSDPTSSAEDRAQARLLAHSLVQGEVNSFRQKYPNWQTEVPMLLRVLGMRHHSKKLSSKSKYHRNAKREASYTSANEKIKKNSDHSEVKLIQEVTNMATVGGFDSDNRVSVCESAQSDMCSDIKQEECVSEEENDSNVEMSIRKKKTVNAECSSSDVKSKESNKMFSRNLAKARLEKGLVINCLNVCGKPKIKNTFEKIAGTMTVKQICLEHLNGEEIYFDKSVDFEVKGVSRGRIRSSFFLGSEGEEAGEPIDKDKAHCDHENVNIFLGRRSMSGVYETEQYFSRKQRLLDKQTGPETRKQTSQLGRRWDKPSIRKQNGRQQKLGWQSKCGIQAEANRQQRRAAARAAHQATDNLHPSWEAKRKQKQLLSLPVFTGKKIKFDE